MTLLDFCLRVMLSSEQLKELGEKEFKESLTGNKDALVKALKSRGISLQKVKDFCREKHENVNIVLIKSVLKSGKLRGHSWEKARPSNLHLSIQNLVRDCFAGKLKIDEYLEKGNNIIKHEFFITAIHDLVEQTIIVNFNDVIPAIASKCTIDFVYDSIPYDLKVTPPLKDWTYEKAKKNPEIFAKSLYEGQDTERIRESAKNSDEFNRLYLVYKEESIWENPEKIEKMVVKIFSQKHNPFTIDVDGKKIRTLVIFLE